MTKVLILNHCHEACGTYQFAKRIYSIVANSGSVIYFYRETKDLADYYEIIRDVKPDYIVLNWHKDRMPWITENQVTDTYLTKHLFLFHDGSTLSKEHKHLFCGELPNYKIPIPQENRILLPRPILRYDGIYPSNNVPTIGSFGFATDHKRFPELVQLVNAGFNEALIRLHITSPYFGVTEGYNLPKIVAKCYANNTNPNVKLTISSNFVDDETLLKFLAGNDINVFNYAYMNNPGISSAIDYALSVRRPFAVTKNNLFRHVASDDILLEKNSIQDIINKGIAPIERYYNIWSPEIFQMKFDELFI